MFTQVLPSESNQSKATSDIYIYMFFSESNQSKATFDIYTI